MSSDHEDTSVVVPPSREWWNGRARARLPPELVARVRALRSETTDDAIRRFDTVSRFKVGILFGGFFATLWLYERLGGGAIVTTLCIAALGLFFIPYTRVFMHSQMHWSMGGSRPTRFLLDHFVSLLFSVPQTGYAIGHRMHHRHDNDFDARGRPKDLQSTFIFSNDGHPTSPFLWVPYFMFVFQHAVVPWIVFTKGTRAERAWYLLELGAIATFHVALARWHADAYWHVVLPGLLIAWTASATVLYMMHAVDASTYAMHPTNTSVSPFFNWFGDNDGYHLEHTLFAAVHPIHLRDVHAILAPDPRQVLDEHYFIAGVRYAFGGQFPKDQLLGTNAREDVSR